MPTDSDRAIEHILRLFSERGDSGYGGEAVTQREHALQSAHYARKTGAKPWLVVAALLHDIGHLLHDLPDDAPHRGVDDLHEALGAAWLENWFGREVSEPVRLHVAAKRYLCAAEPAYLEQLSEPSLLSLRLQGGEMSPGELKAFRNSAHFESAVLLRRWDDAAKVPEMTVAGIEECFPDLQAALKALDAGRGLS